MREPSPRICPWLLTSFASDPGLMGEMKKMGTFHDTNDPLHGITVVAQVGQAVYVGR